MTSNEERAAAAVQALKEATEHALAEEIARQAERDKAAAAADEYYIQQNRDRRDSR